MPPESAEQVERIKQDIITFLRANFPQIEMHGGSFSVEEVKTGTAEATVRLSGACSGCGISPMTVQAVKKRLPKQIDGVNTVDVYTGEEEPDITSGPF